jgi:dipeptidyl aminopeptidase/acylaminoacyl peptidase
MKPRALSTLVFLVALGGGAAGQTTSAPNGARIVKEEPYAFPAFERARDLEPVATRDEYERVTSDTAFSFTTITYMSDGVPVTAYVYKPRAAPAKRLPVIVYNRGSYVVGDIGYKLAPMFNRLAREGFLVVAPLYRGSNGAPGLDELGGGDLADLMNVRAVLAELPQADTENVFLYGESRGGIMAFMAIRDGFGAKAAATFGSITDFDAYVTSANPQILELCRKIWPRFDAERAEITRRRSALAWADRLRTPLLLMHGGADSGLDPAQTLALAQALHRAKLPYELHVYAGDNHVLARNRVDRDRRVAEWFRKHVR